MLLYIKATVQLLPISGEPVAATFSEPSLTGISIYEPLPSSSSSLWPPSSSSLFFLSLDDSDDEVDASHKSVPGASNLSEAQATVSREIWSQCESPLDSISVSWISRQFKQVLCSRPLMTMPVRDGRLAPAKISVKRRQCRKKSEPNVSHSSILLSLSCLNASDSSARQNCTFVYFDLQVHFVQGV